MNYNGTKIINYNGTKIIFWIDNNRVSATDHWELIYDLRDAGYFTMSFDRSNYGHSTFYITEKFLSEPALGESATRTTTHYSYA